MKRLSLLCLLLFSAACVVGEGYEQESSGGGGDGSGGGAGDGSGGGMGDGSGGGGGGGGMEDPDPALLILEAFGECMTFEDWEAQDLGEIAHIVTDENDRQCFECHDAGQRGNNFLNEDSETTFENIRNYPFILRYVRVDEELDPYASEDLPNHAENSQTSSHLAFTLPPELAEGIVNFFELTKARYDDNLCDPI